MGPAVRQAFPSGLARAVVVKASAYAAAVAMDGARDSPPGASHRSLSSTVPDLTPPSRPHA